MANKGDGDRFGLLIASMAALSSDEGRKAKSLYVRNELAKYEEELENARSSWGLLLLFALIPLFWPFIYFARRSTIASARAQHRRIQSALDVWREDLGDDASALATDLEKLSARPPRMLPFMK